MTDESTLRSEFDGEEGSFLLQLRCEFNWDHEAFERLTIVMFKAATAARDQPAVVKRVAQGFWYASWFVRSWACHPDFPRPYSSAYYETAFGLLDDLAYHYFVGELGYREGSFQDTVALLGALMKEARSSQPDGHGSNDW